MSKKRSNILYGPAYNFHSEEEKALNQEKIDSILTDTNWRINSMVAKNTLRGLLAQPETVMVYQEVSLVGKHKKWKTDFVVFHSNRRISICEANGYQHSYYSDLIRTDEEFLNSTYRSMIKEISAEFKDFSRMNINLLIPYHKRINFKEAEEKSEQQLAMEEAVKSEEFRKVYLEAMNSNTQVNFNIRMKGRVFLNPRRIPDETQLNLADIKDYVTENILLNNCIDLLNDYLINIVTDHRHDFFYEKKI